MRWVFNIIKELEDEQLKLGYRLGNKSGKKEAWESGRDAGLVVGFDDAIQIVKKAIR